MFVKTITNIFSVSRLKIAKYSQNKVKKFDVFIMCISIRRSPDLASDSSEERLLEICTIFGTHPPTLWHVKSFITIVECITIC